MCAGPKNLAYRVAYTGQKRERKIDWKFDWQLRTQIEVPEFESECLFKGSRTDFGQAL